MRMSGLSKSVTAELDVLQTNDEFYRAVESGDLKKMQSVWLHEDWVRCLHPGWDLLVGWEAVEESWSTIFESSTIRTRVAISRPLVHVRGDTAWVSCIEHVTATVDNDFATALVEATNIFVRHETRWRLVHHHTTPLPGRKSDRGSLLVQ